MEIGPTSMRYVPSTSNVPSARMIGRPNWPWPHPTARLHPVSATDRQAPSPVHRPVASGPSLGPAGLRLQASRPPHVTTATVNRRAVRRLMTRYNADLATIKASIGKSAVRRAVARRQRVNTRRRRTSHSATAVGPRITAMGTATSTAVRRRRTRGRRHHGRTRARTGHRVQQRVGQNHLAVEPPAPTESREYREQDEADHRLVQLHGMQPGRRAAIAQNPSDVIGSARLPS